MDPTACLIALLACSGTPDANWPHWRGPDATGMARGDVPLHFGDDRNVRWKIDVPGRGFSTPIVWGDRMFLTTAVPTANAPDEVGGEEFHGGGGPHGEQSFEVHCLDRHTGEMIWQRVATVATPFEGFHRMYGSFASYSPVTDGERLYVSFGSFGLYCYDLDGELLWKSDECPQMHMRRQFGEGGAPALHGDTLVHVFDQEEQSSIMAFDTATGDVRWRRERDEPSTWATPLITSYEGRRQVVTSGANFTRCYDLGTGELIWKCAGLGLNGIPNPLRHDDVVLLMTGYREGNLMAVRLGGRGDVTDSERVLWSSKRGLSYTCQPVLHEGLLYAVMDRGLMSCFDAVTGETHYLEQRLPRGSKFKSSPVGVNGKIYVASESGDVFVTRMGTEFELLAENLLTDEFFVSSPVVVDDTLYLRSLERLFCIAEEDAAADAGARAGVIWPSYRGPRASGVSDGHRLATTWSVADGTNVKWKTPIPGLAHSSPVISGDSLFVTSAEKEGEAELKVGLYGSVDPVEDDSEHDFTVYCVDRNDGSIKWRRSAWRGVPAVKRHPKGSHAASSPATDGKRVVAFFGAEGLYCYSTDGELKWKRDLGKLRAGWYERHTPDWGFASSPVIHEDLVLVQCDVIDDSFVAALSLEDGSDVWRTTREGVVPAWSTPTVDIREGRSQVIVNGYLRAAGYDLRSGRELWRIGGGGDIPVPTPIIAHDLVFLTSAHGRMRPIHAVHPMALGEIPTSPADTEHLAWSYPRRGNYMQTPIAYGDELYCCNDAGVVGCYDVRTGEEHYRQRLGSGGSGFTASAVAGDGKVYFTSEEGAIHVVRAGRTFEVVAVNEMGEECMATPAIAEGVLYWRTRGQVVAIEARAP